MIDFSSESYRKYGIHHVTGEACGLGMRILFGLDKTAFNALEIFLGVPLNRTPFVTSEHSSMMLPHELAKEFFMYRVCFEHGKVLWTWRGHQEYLYPEGEKYGFEYALAACQEHHFPYIILEDDHDHLADVTSGKPLYLNPEQTYYNWNDITNVQQFLGISANYDWDLDCHWKPTDKNKLTIRLTEKALVYFRAYREIIRPEVKHVTITEDGMVAPDTEDLFMHLATRTNSRTYTKMGDAVGGARNRHQFTGLTQ